MILRRQLVYSSGRIFTYATVGAVAGYAGMRLAGRMSAVVNMQAVLALVAGGMLIVQGLLSAGVISWPRHRRLPACLAPGLISAFMREERLSGAFLAGVFTGFLPCGLVYAYVALAASAGSAAAGLAHMAAFGAGTAPLLVAVGTGGSLLGLTTRATGAARRRLFRHCHGRGIADARGRVHRLAGRRIGGRLPHVSIAEGR